MGRVSEVSWREGERKRDKAEKRRLPIVRLGMSFIEWLRLNKFPSRANRPNLLRYFSPGCREMQFPNTIGYPSLNYYLSLNFLRVFFLRRLDARNLWDRCTNTDTMNLSLGFRKCFLVDSGISINSDFGFSRISVFVLLTIKIRLLIETNFDSTTNGD